MITGSDSCLPIVVGVGPPGNDALASLIQAHRSRRPFAVLVDLDVCPRPPPGSFSVVGRPADLRRALEAPVAVAQVASAPRMRNALIPMCSGHAPQNLRVFADEHDAIAWSLQRLTQANVRSLPSHEQIHRALRELRASYVHVDDFDPTAGSPSSPLLTEVASLIRLFDRPAFLVRSDGSTIAMNEAAQRQRRTTAWLAEVTGAKTRDPQTCARLFRLRGYDAYVVVPVRPWEVPPQFAGILKPWPPRLRQTAELLVEGLTDKEIARRLNTSHATARTYVIRVFRRCGVHSRAELRSQ